MRASESAASAPTPHSYLCQALVGVVASARLSIFRDDKAWSVCLSLATRMLNTEGKSSEEKEEAAGGDVEFFDVG